jgi:hypothetical protein
MTVSVKAPTSTTGSIQLNGSDVLTIDSSGNLTAPNNLSITGNITSAIKSTGGIYLGGTATANLLDDYEEGTFSPNLKEGSNLLTTSSASGTYIKIGKFVYGNIQIGNITKSGTGNLGFDLPFTVSDYPCATVQYNRFTHPANSYTMTGYLTHNGSTVILYWNESANSNASPVVATDIADGTNADLVMTFTYKTT